jgi:signal transduction histidine kinase
VNLFLEEIGFMQFLEYEINLFSHMYEDITFISHIDEGIGFIKIDKIQFQQVISNLLDNAVKFTEDIDAIIAVKAQKIV